MIRPARFRTSFSGGGGLVFSLLKCESRFSASRIDFENVSLAMDMGSGEQWVMRIEPDRAVGRELLGGLEQAIGVGIAHVILLRMMALAWPENPGWFAAWNDGS